MNREFIDVRNSAVEILRGGKGDPILYLHGIWDLHSAQGEPFAFHSGLAEQFELIAPAHPGCGESTGVKDVSEIEDLAFHYLDLLDVLSISQANIVGFDLGGWIAVEMAIRNPERIGRMALIGSAGLQRPDALIGDFFMYSQHRDGGVMSELRSLLFKEESSEIAIDVLPDGRVAVPDEVRRYKSLTLAGRVGWEPPYLHDIKLERRLHRALAPTLLVWGRHDRLVPLANGEAYAAALPNARLVTIDDAGHSAHIEKPGLCLDLICEFISTGTLSEIRAPDVSSA